MSSGSYDIAFPHLRPDTRARSTRPGRALCSGAVAQGAHDPAVLLHRLDAVEAALAAKAAVHGHAEVVEVARGGGVAAPQARHTVDGQDDAEKDARRSGLEIDERAKEAAVLAAQVARTGEVQP